MSPFKTEARFALVIPPKDARPAKTLAFAAADLLGYVGTTGAAPTVEFRKPR